MPTAHAPCSARAHPRMIEAPALQNENPCSVAIAVVDSAFPWTAGRSQFPAVLGAVKPRGGVVHRRGLSGKSLLHLHAPEPLADLLARTAQRASGPAEPDADLRGRIAPKAQSQDGGARGRPRSGTDVRPSRPG